MGVLCTSEHAAHRPVLKHHYPIGPGRWQEKPEKPDRPSSEGGEVATSGLTDKPIVVSRRAAAHPPNEPFLSTF